MGFVLLIDTESVRRQISRRGIKVYLGLAHHLRTLADPDTGLVNKYDLERSLIEYSIKVSQDVRYLYVCVDLMNEGETNSKRVNVAAVVFYILTAI